MYAYIYIYIYICRYTCYVSIYILYMYKCGVPAQPSSRSPEFESCAPAT